MTVDCPYCGSFEAPGGNRPGRVSFTQTNYAQNGEPICPRCDMTPCEHRYRLLIMADSAAVYAREVREFNAKRAKKKA